MSNVLFYEPFHHFDRLFDQALRPRVNSESSPQFERNNNSVVPKLFKPRMDLHEDSEKNLVSATFELPGIKKEDVQLEVMDGLLTISAETKSSVEHEERGYAIRERQFGKYSRTLRLPRGVNDGDIKAAMIDGVLTVTFPKVSAEQEPKRISVA